MEKPEFENIPGLSLFADYWKSSGNYFIVQEEDPVQLNARPLPSSAWAGRGVFDSEVEMEAAKCLLYRRPKFRAVKLLF